MEYIPYGRQEITNEDINAVINTLKSNWLTQGPIIPAFEKKIAEYATAEFTVATCNATAALHLACKALGVTKNDRVWTSPNTFVASANCALYCGAEIDFVDICPETYNISVLALEKKLKVAQRRELLPKVLIPVHFAGQSCDMQAIKELSDIYGFKIIEDASHAIGGSYQNTPIGSCTFSDITVFSFHPVKIITTGEGGACLTKDKSIAAKLQLYRTHGITKNESLMTKKSEGPWYYQQLELGFNFRITDLQCALGISQLSRLDEIVKKRNSIARYYDKKLQGLPLKLPTIMPSRLSSYHLYTVQILPECGRSRRGIFDSLRNNGIGVNVHYIPVHLQPFYQDLGFKKGDYPESEAYYENALSLPIFPTLSREQQNFVIDTLASQLK
ncbi:MAG: UDP-4-amino-4,6-dideoxy-N-acetyl-beta-L-altrosamine transaminase [Coxiellaceae bacterium]|nr:UDP-4-amino-4,6-dideoxy-N-acetyl-beta-L-altrosamine transaminase [Coxiellaceae bacterium]